MSRKPYTLKEMKQIVDYLVERKAYSEIRGRKMWMDLANSKILNRTWQSLKETFLKRILSDLNNPYYKLSVEQVSSFRQEYDVEARYNTNKLEIHTVSDSSSTDNQRGKDMAGLKKEVENTGEDKCSTIQNSTRSSTETLVLENCYNTAEDIQRDLESPKNNEKSAQKSIRDFITYSEPLTPMLQEVLHDFSTDDEEPQLKIVEDSNDALNTEKNTTNTEKNDTNNVPEVDTIRKTQSYDKNTNLPKDGVSENAPQTSKIKSLKLKKTRKGTWENKEAAPASSTAQDEEENNNKSKGATTCHKKSSNQNEQQTSFSNTNSTVDTQLPNNPEALENGDKRTSTESTNSDISKKKKANKRSRSRSSTEQKKKTKDKHRDSSKSNDMQKDTQTFNSHPHAAGLMQSFGDQENTQNAQETNNVTNVNGSEENDTAQKSSPAKKPKTDEVQRTSPKKNNEGTSQEAGPSSVNDVSVNASDINPCLKSVSLFAEQFSQSKHSDSDSEGDDQTSSIKLNQESNNNKDSANNKQNVDEQNENSASTSKTKESYMSNASGKNNKLLGKSLCVDNLLLKSHSESESESCERPKMQNGGGRIEKSREVALANAFGFSSGAASFNRMKNGKSHSKRFSRRNRLVSRSLVSNVETGSSDEYTTASESDDAPSPRGRNGGHSHRYMKPQSYDFLSNNDDGGMYVIGRKKLYPLLLRESNGLYHAYGGEGRDSEENESYWKNKFLEERKKCAEEKIRADELSRLLQQANGQPKQAERVTPVSPILQANQTLSTIPERNNKEIKKKEPAVSEVEKKTEETVKIKFTKNHEIELEGQWPHVNPLLERMVEIFNKNNGSPKRSIPNNPGPQIEEDTTKTETREITEAGKESNKQTETETKLLEETSKPQEKTAKKVNVKRKRGSKNVDNKDEPITVSSGKSTPSVTTGLDPEVHEKVTNIENEIFKKIEEIEQSDQSVPKETASDANVTTRTRGRPKKSPLSPQPASATVSAPKKAKVTTRAANTKSSATDIESDAGTSMKRPSRMLRRVGSDTGLIVQNKAKSKLALSNKSDTRIPEDDPTVRYMLPPSSRAKKIVHKANNISYPTRRPRLFTSPASFWIHSESTQDYQDSDISPPKSVPRRKRRVSLGSLHNKGQLRKVKRRSSPYLADDDSNETTELPHIKSGSMPNLSVNSEEYRSESYQLLMPKKKNFSQLDKIDESPAQIEVTETEHKFTNLSPLTINVNNEYYVPTDVLGNDLGGRRSSENSSNISFPLSPVLSIAENISISKETIDHSFEDNHNFNENRQSDVTNLNKYLMSDIDVSVPLMEQDCEFENGQIQIRKTDSRVRKTPVSKSLKSKNKTAKSKEQSCNDSLDQKLRDLLLESAKKMTQYHLDNPMEVDPPSEKKSKPRKRSSTPRKRQTALKSKSPNVEPVLEEHTETCSFGRKSCPPVISIIPCEEAEARYEKENISRPNIAQANKDKKKKDIIKVKIQRPRNKNGAKKSNNSGLSVCTDSGINDTESALSDDCRCCSESTELIHNHSDTCLQLDECVGDSVEFIDTTPKSIISLNSNSAPSEVCVDNVKSSSGEYLTPDLFCTDARDATSLSDVSRSNTQGTNTDPEGAFNTPLSEHSYNSLVTDDLSDEPPPEPQNKWFLFGDDDTNFFANVQESACGVGSNLKQIFPITCAVPDLSTITEQSKDNDSMRPNLNADSERRSFSPSIFDTMF